MAWMTINDSFSIYSVREDYIQLFDWLMYFIQSNIGYFYFGITLILIAIVIISIATRFEVFAKRWGRN